MTPTLKPFATALLQFALLALGAFVLIPATSYGDPVTWLQFGALVAGAVASVWVPLADVKWRAAFKTGVVVLGGALSAAIPLVVEGVFPVASVPLLGLAVLQILATETGVQIRTYVPKH
jgi:hypothetical protein